MRDYRIVRNTIYSIFVVFILILTFPGCDKRNIEDEVATGESIVNSGVERVETPEPFRPRLLEENWKSEEWVKQNSLSVPSDATVDDRGGILVAEAWDTISMVVESGADQRAVNIIDDRETEDIEKLKVYSIEYKNGRIWSYNFATGSIWRIEPDERSCFTASEFHFDELFTPMESVITVDSLGRPVIAVNRRKSPGQKISAEIYIFDHKKRSLQKIRDIDFAVKAICFSAESGTMFVAGDDYIYETGSPAGELKPYHRISSGRISYNGMAISPSGDIYIATGDWSDTSEVIRIREENGRISEERICSKPGGGLEGICITGGPDGKNAGEHLIATCRKTGELFYIPTQGRETECGKVIIEGNGLSLVQMMQWGSDKQGGNPLMYISDGETGRIMKIDSTGRVTGKLADIVNYNNIGSKMILDPKTGYLLFALCAPGFEKLHGLNAIPTWDAGPVKSIFQNPSVRPSSVAIDRDGAMLVTDLREKGRILRIEGPDKASVLLDSKDHPLLRYPIGLLGMPDGSLFASVNRYDGPSYAGVPWADTIVKFYRDEGGDWKSQIVYDGLGDPDAHGIRPHPAINDFAVSATGDLYIALNRRIIRSSPPYSPGREEIFADNFNYALALAFDELGRLYISDAETGSVWRMWPAN